MTEQKIERVEVTILLPKKLMDFLEANKAHLAYKDVAAYITFSVLQTVQGDLESGDLFADVKKAVEYELGKNNDP
jgi:hypothetical protein